MIGIDFDLAKYIAHRKGLMDKRVRDGAAYAYVGEHKVRRALISARPVLIAIEGTSRLWRGSARKQLLGTSVKATDQHHRRVYQAGNRAAAALDMAPPAIYIASRDVPIDARALGTDDDACIVISETVIDRLSDAEVLAVVAQQLGHIQNAHIPYATALYYLQHEAVFFVRWVVQPAIMTLQAWSRRAEITCDRASLLVTRNLDVSLSALVKLASKGDVDVAAYLADVPDAKGGVGRYAEYFRTQPLLSKRVAALKLFAQSTFYKHTVGEDIAGGTSSEETDRRVGEIFERVVMTKLLDRHQQVKKDIIAHYRELADTAEAIGMTTMARDLRTTRIPKLEEEQFFLVVLGEFNHGKSTFVNAMLGADVLPVGITPTTAAINHVVHADAPRAHAVLKSGEKKHLSPADLKDWVTVSGSQRGEVSFVELGYPAEILGGNITLVDTPGVNDLNEQRAEITYGYVPRADAVIFLLDAGQALKDSEREFLASHVLEGSRERMVFVLGKMDLLTPAERQAVLDYVREGLGKLMPDPVVFAVSAKRWLDGGHADSGMTELLDYLNRFLDTDRAQIILDNAAADAMRSAAYLSQNLGLKQRAFELDVGELETRVASMRAQLDASKRTLDELHNRIRADAMAIKAQVKMELESFARAFAGAVPEQIDLVDADDVKRYLGSFIEDKFREWAELQGAKVAAMLEKLAEDVIAVTNENVAAASSELASRLGPTETEVEITVDSFKYDVGVYAIGTLGTAVFLFVNTLAGGLLTLAAPILAIVVKSKVAGDIREQAKERVPGVILRAADAMAPHFESCIDDFAGRLRAFVNAAGVALYKGISEILDRAIEERKSGEGRVAELRVETDDRAQRVIEMRAKLETLRSSLWQKPVEPA